MTHLSVRKIIMASCFKYLVLVISVVTLASFAMCSEPEGPMSGGQTDERDGDAGAQEIANLVKPQVQAKLGANQPLSEYVVEKYRTQVVAGANYFLKIRIAPGKYIHAEVFKPLPYANAGPQLTGLEVDKTQQDKIGFVTGFPQST